MNERPRLLFVSPRFLFPAESGGQIRTTEVLRNLRGGAFEVTLTCPATIEQLERHGDDADKVCDRLVTWQPRRASRLSGLTRMRHIVSELPISVATDRSVTGSRVVALEISRSPDVAVFDFAHAAVLAPADVDRTASVLFTHNVEAEIFGRHAQVARDAVRRWIWHNQHLKMRRFERAALRRFDRVIAVSERDRNALVREYGIESVSVIPTGVDLDFFRHRDPGAGRGVVFVGSMDWMANVDAMEFLLSDVWPAVAATVSDASMMVVGRNPPRVLVDRARAANSAWTFTGRVDDIRPHMARAAVCVIPLRVGGGTRIKAFEAMAMGIPVVSTSVGVEGLGVGPGEHFVRADTAQELANGIIELLEHPERGRQLARRARAYVEAHFSNAVVGRRFEAICVEAVESRRARCSRRTTSWSK